MNNKNTLVTTLKRWFFFSILFFVLNLLIPPITYSKVISPRISLTTFNDPTGLTINIDGIGFSAGSSATIYIKSPDGSQSLIKNIIVSQNGSFSISHLFSTGYPPGIYLIWAVDDSTGKYSNREKFKIPAPQPAKIEMPSIPSPPPSLPPNIPSYTPKHGDLVRAKGNTKIYYIEGQQIGPQITYQRRGIGSEEVFNKMGFRWENIKEIEYQDLMNIPEGKPIWSKELISSFPEGSLIRAKGKSQTYVIQGGRKCYIPDPETFQSRGYSWDQVQEVDQEVLDSIITGLPLQSVKAPYQYRTTVQQPSTPQTQPSATPSTTVIQPSGSPSTSSTQIGSPSYQTQTSLPDGTLIKGSGPDIYLIENGVRRLIPDMETFNAMGLNRNNIITLDEQQLRNIPIGIPLPKKKK